MMRVIRTRGRASESRRARESSPTGRPGHSTAFTRRSLGLSGTASFFPRRTASGPVDTSASALTSPPSPPPPPLPRPFDPLALVRRLPTRVAAPCYVKSARHLAVFSRFERYWLELRGRLVVMMLHDEWPTRRSADPHVEHPPPKDAVVVAVFTVERCLVLRPRPKAPVLKITNPTHNHHVWLRFDNDVDCFAWEKALTAVAAQRVVGISDFEFISPIGKGASGKVFLVSDRSTGEKLALKVIEKAKVFESRSAFRHALDERLALEMVDGHPFFSRLRYAFQTRAYFYLAIDFYDGGDLYQYLRTHNGRLRESQVRAVSAEVLLALEHLHGLGFVYRDLKPENVLLDTKGHVRLADFGLCKLLPDKSLTNTICGTHTYAAPEMLSVRNYGMSIDLWAYGVFVYHILRGRTPYEARDLDQVIANMNNRRIRFSSGTSPELVSMIKKLLDWNPDTRLGCGTGAMVEVRGHSFFKGLDWRKVYTRDEALCGLFARNKGTCGGVRAHVLRLLADKEEHSDRGGIAAGGNGGNGGTSVSTGLVRGDGDDGSPLASADAGGSGSGGADEMEAANAGRRRGGSAEDVSNSSEGDAARRKSGGPAMSRRKTTDVTTECVSLREQMVAAAEEDDLRNFDMSEWGKISVDNDHDDAGYGDGALWPFSRARRKLVEEERMIAGFGYCSCSTPLGVPDNL